MRTELRHAREARYRSRKLILTHQTKIKNKFLRADKIKNSLQEHIVMSTQLRAPFQNLI